MTRTATCIMTNRNQCCKNAFSMIELLVVMAIIFILAGLSIGSYQKIRQSSLRANCMANLKNISYSMCMYLSDHNNAMMQYQNASGDNWTTILVENEYLHEGNYFEPVGVTSGNARDVGLEPLHCPNDMSDSDVFFQDKYAAGGSYAINKDISSSPSFELKWSHIKNAHMKVLLCDYNQQGMLSAQNARISAGTNSNNWKSGGTNNTGTIGSPHFGGTNCLFADWHVAPKHLNTFEEENFSLETNFN